MTDLLEPPPLSAVPPQLRPFAFDRAKSAEANARRAELQRIRNTQKPPEPPPVTATAIPDERVALVQEQIAHTRAALNGKLEPNHRAALNRSLCELMDRERILRGEPLPGSRKPSGKLDRPAPAARMSEVVTVSESPSCGVDTATGGVPVNNSKIQTPQLTQPIGWEYDTPKSD